MVDIGHRIRFTWGGGALYGVYLCFAAGRYEPIIYDLKSCYEAQRIVHRGNSALQRWFPDLLHPEADLPGVGFQYPAPESVHPQSPRFDHAQKLREMALGKTSVDVPAWQLNPIGARVARIGFDMQRVHNLTDVETFALIAHSLAEMVNSMEKREMERMMVQSTLSILIPKDSVNA